MASFNVTNSNDSGEGSLRAAITLANETPGKDDVFVQTDVELNSAIEITESVNIGTPFGATITQTNQDRIFYIQDGDIETKADVSLYRLNLTGGNGFIGGAIISYENLNITDSSLYNNSAVATGAAVYVANSNLTVERTSVYDNQITSEPDIEDGDLFVLDGELTLLNLSSESDEASAELVTESSNIVAELAELDVTKSANLEEAVSEQAISSNIESTAIAETTAESTESFVVGGDESDTILGEEDFKILEGNSRSNNILGESDRDLIKGNSGDDTLKGNAGNDDLRGGDGSDILDGGAGNDSLDGGMGDDNLDGGAGDDLLKDAQGKNILFGNDGSDRLIGGDDLDNLNGGAGNDKLYGGKGDDTLSGEVGNDTLHGGAGADTLIGGAGKDLIRGAAGNDIMHGDAGNDILIGAVGDDIIHGDAGNDTLSGGSGENFLLGGSGSDVFNLAAEGNNTVADFEIGTDRLQLLEISFNDLDITGDFNSMIGYKGTQIGMLIEVNPAELSADSFIEA